MIPIQPIVKAAEAITNAETILITAGAGMGVDSGLPDFRGDKGFWQLYPSYAEKGLTFADLANPTWFHTHPERAWGFYGYRYNLYRDTQPHQGFQILKSWLANKPNPGFVYTSNVDGHFQKAGFSHDQVYECHGSINYLQCLRSDCNGKIWSANQLRLTIDPQTLLATSELPRCPDCGFYARPNILMFNDWAWIAARAEQQSERFHDWKQATRHSDLVIIEIGAGVSVGKVRFISQTFNKATLIRINPQDPQGPSNTISIAMPGLAALTAIEEILQSRYPESQS